MKKSKLKELRLSKRVLAGLMAAFLAVTSVDFSGLRTSVKAEEGSQTAAMPWRELPPAGQGAGSTGTQTKIEFLSGGLLGNMYKGVTRIDRYIDTSDLVNGADIILPTAEDVGQPNKYKDNNDNKNYYLAGWAAVPHKSEYENSDGSFHGLEAKDIKYFQPGEAVHLDESFVNATGKIIFHPDWKPISYDYGVDDSNILGGLRKDLYDGKAIKSDLYDYNSLIVNLYNSYIGPRGWWNDAKTGILFVDGEYADEKSIQRPQDRWMAETEPGYVASVNTWTGNGGGAAQGLWDKVNYKMFFDANTPGVTYVGNADEGPMYWYDNNKDSKYYGYYVYNSEESAASYNQSLNRFYIYNQPQKGEGWNDWRGFLPFNKPRNEKYDSRIRDWTLNDSPNYHFGMVTQVDFFLTGDVGKEGANKIKLEDGSLKDMEFYFSGDDDVFVFVDDKLALDIGGIHGIVEGSINFSTGEVVTSRTQRADTETTQEIKNNESIKDLKSGNHRLTIYYMERGSNESNNLTAFRLVLPATLQIQKLETQTGEPAVFPGAEFYLQNKAGEYYHIQKNGQYITEGEIEDDTDPLNVPRVSYTNDKETAYKFRANDKGVITMKFIADGEYTLTEIGAPTYYEGLPGSFSFTVGNAKIEDGSLEFYENNEYYSDSQPYTEDPNWSDKVKVENDKVTINVSNDRPTKPLVMKKSFDDDKVPAGVKFNIYELQRAPLKEDASIDFDAVKVDGVPTEVRHVYEGITDNNGIVTNYTHYPRGKNITPDEMIQRGLETANLKQGAVYYIVEDYYDEDYYKLENPIVVAVDQNGVYLVSDPESNSLKFEGIKVLQNNGQGYIEPKEGEESAELDVTNITVTTEEPIKKVNGNPQQKDKLDAEGNPIYKVKKVVERDAEGNVVTDNDGNLVYKDLTDEEGNPVYYLDTQGNKVTEKEWDPNQIEELAARDTVFTYTITQRVPANTTKMTIVDKLEDVLEVVGKPTISPNNYGVFKVTVDGNTVTASGDDETISGANPIADMAKVNAEVTLTIKAKIKAGVSDAQLKELYNGTTDIPNTATVKINDDPEVETNEVKVTPPGEVEQPKKSIKESPEENKDHLLLAERQQEYTYVIEQPVPARSKSITVSDTIENVLEFTGTKDDVVITLVDGENETTLTEADETVTVTQTERNLTVKLTGAAATNAGNKVLRVEFKARLKDGISDEYLLKLYKDENNDPTTSIPNTATVTIDNTSNVTNEVLVTPPPTPEKRVNGDVHVVLENANEEFTYEIKQYVPKDATEVTFEDTLSTLLDFEGTYTVEAEDVKDGNRTAVTSGTVAEDAEKLELSLTDKLDDLKGKIVVVTFKAKFNKDVLDANGEISEEKLEELKGHKDWENVVDNGEVATNIGEHSGVINDARVKVVPYNDGKFTNKVTVTPPTTEPGGLDVLKQVKPLDEITEELQAVKFTFTVELTAPEGKVLPDHVNVTFNDATESQPLNIVDGKVTFELSHGGVAHINGLPHGTTYKVTETPNDKFTTDVASGEGSIVSGISKEATVINTEKEPPAPGNLDIVKMVNGDADEDATFTFEVELTKAADAEDINYEEITVAIDNGEATAVTLNEGKITVTIKNGQVAHIKGIPNGTAYKVIEVKADGYDVERKLSDEGAISSNNTATAMYVNKPEPTENPVKKVGAAADNTSKDKLKLTDRKQEYFYSITQKVPSFATKLTFEDELERVLRFAENPEIKLNGTAIETQVSAEDAANEEVQKPETYYVINGQKLTVVVQGEAAKTLRGQDAEVTFKSVLGNFSDAQLIEIYGNTDIPNKATVTINNNSKTTNEVEVTPPTESQKTIRNDVHAVLANATETFEYEITTFIPEEVESVEVSDTLSEFLVIDNVEATNAIAVEANGQTVQRAHYRETKDAKSLLIEFVDLSEIKGKTLVVKFNAKFDPTLVDSNNELTPAALERIKAAYGQVAADENGSVVTNIGDHEGIINEANIKLDGNDKPTNKVTVIPPSTEPGTLTVKKTVNKLGEEYTEEELNTEFQFTVVFTDKDDQPLAADIISNIVVKVNDEVSDIKVDETGKAVFNLKHSETARFEGLPGGTKYVVTEEIPEDSYFEQVSASGAEGSILATTNKDAEIHNKLNPPKPGSLSILKAVSGNVPAGEENREFTFEVELKDESGATLNPRQIEGLLLNGNPLGTNNVKDGKIVLTLKANEQATITGIPVGTSYVASENTENLVTFELDTDNQVNWTGKIEDNDKISAVFINKPVTPPSDPTKAVNGKEHEDLASKDSPFTYTVTQFIPVGTKSVTFEDKLNGQLRFVGNARVTGGDLSKLLNPTGTTLSFELTPEEIALLEGNVMTVTFNAKYADEATDETIDASYVGVKTLAEGEIMAEKADQVAADDANAIHVGTPNQAKTKVGDHEAYTNTVTVTAPPDVDKPEKGFNAEGKLVDYDDEGREIEPKLNLTGRDDTFTYYVEQSIPESLTLKSLSFSDTIESVLEFIPASNANAKIVEVSYDEEGNMTTGANVPADIKIDGRTITATPKSLENLAGKTLRFSFDAKIKAGVKDEELLRAYGQTTNIPNTATVNVNGSPLGTNEVLVTPPGEEEAPEKKILADSEASAAGAEAHKGTSTLQDRNEEFTYYVSQKVPVGAYYLEFSDTLVEVLEFAGKNGNYTITDSEGNNVDAQVTVNGKTITAKVGSEVAPQEGEVNPIESLQGKTVTLTFKAKLVDGIKDDELYGKYVEKSLSVPNEATVKVNDKPLNTNKVFVTPPPTEPEKPEKTVNDDKYGTPADQLTDGEKAKGAFALSKRHETFEYKVTQKVPVNATNVTFVDTLENVLEVAKDTQPVLVDEAGNEITKATVSVKGQRITAVLSDKATLEANTNKQLTLVIKAQIKSGVKDADLVSAYGAAREIPNDAIVIIGKNSETTNEVKVVPPTEPEDPEKKVNGQKEPVELEERTSEFTYTISQRIPESASVVTFTDKLEKVLEVVGEPTIAYENGDAVKATYTITSEEENGVYTVVAKTEDATEDRNQVVVLTINAKIRDDIKDADLVAEYGSTYVPNKAEVNIDDDGKVTNEVLVTPPTPKDEPEKKVSDKDQTDVNFATLEERTEVFTYKVSQKTPAGLAKLEFEDTLASVVEYVEGSAKLTDGQTEVAADKYSVTLVDDTVEELNANKESQPYETKKLVVVVEDAETLKALEEKEVTLTFEAKIKEGIKDSELIAKYGSTQVPNKATVKINGNPKSTNEVKVTPPETPGEKPEKKVEGEKYGTPASQLNEGETEKSAYELKNRMDEFTYSVSQKLPEEVSKVSFSDTVESVLEIIPGSATVLVDNEDKTESYNIQINGRTITATAEKGEGEDNFADANKTVVLSFKAKLKAGITDARLIEEYGTNKEIPNSAVVTIDDDPKVSNEVKVTPPETTRKDPTKDVEGMDENGNVIPVLGETEDSIKLMNRQDTFTYTIKQEIPVGAYDVKFTDILKDVLEVVGTPVVSVDGKAIDANVEVIGGQAISAEVKDATAYADKTMVLTIHAKIKAGTSDETLIALYGNAREIPNQATVTIDNDGKATNIVKVTPPEEPKDPEKFINDQKELVNLPAADITTDMDEEAVSAAIKAAREKEFTYKVVQVIPENANTVTITDTVEAELGIIDGSAKVNVVDADGNAVEVAVAPQVNGNTVTFTLDGIQEAKLAKGTITLEFNAQITASDEVLLARAKSDKYEKDYSGTTVVPNKAEVQFDFEDTPRTTNTVEVTPPPTPSDEPEKKVNGKDLEKLEAAEGQELSEARQQPFTYTVSQKVPSGAVKIEFSDTLEKVLEFTGTPSLKAGETDLSDKINTNGQVITAVVDDADVLATLVGQEVVLTFDAKIKAEVKDSDIIAEYGTLAIPNKAKVAINGTPKTSNEVKVIPPDTPGDNPEKFVEGEKHGTDDNPAYQLANRTDTFTYTVSQKLPEEVAQVTFSDKVENVLVIDEASAQILGSKDASKYVIKVDGQTITATAEDASADAGETITLSFDAHLKPGTKDKDLIAAYGEKMEIPNFAIVTIDNNPKVTNTVKVTPPPTEHEQPKKEVTPDGEGTVNGEKTEAKLMNRKETFTYTISQKIPAGAVNVQFDDVLERVLEVVGKPTVTVDGKAVEGASVNVRNGRIVNATVADASAYGDKTMVLTIKAQIKDGVKDAQLIALYGDARQIPNEATVTIDNEGKSTNEVKVTPPGEPEDPTKQINGDTKLVTLTDRNEEFEYTVSQVIPENAKTVTITDTIEKELIFKNAGSFSHEGGVISINGKTIKVEINDATALRGETVTLTFKAAIDPEVGDAQLLAREGRYNKTTVIPNTAEVKFDFEDDPRQTNTVEVTPPPTPSEQPKKTVGVDAENQSEELLELTNRDQEYVYVVSQKIPAGAVNVVFSDQLEDVLEVVSTKFSVDGIEVKQDGQLVTATIEDATALADQVVTLTINAKIKEGVLDKDLIAKYKSTQVPNKATVTINSNPNTTNEVRVTPPETPGEKPEKKVNGQEKVQLASRRDEFTYTVSQKIADDANTVEFSDTVEGVLEIVADSASIDGKATYVPSIDGQTIKFTTEDATADRGQTVTMTFKAKLKSGIGDEQLITLYGEAMEIPNYATVTMDDNPKVTNTVKVTPPPAETPEPEKKVNGQKEPVALAERQEQFEYTISQVIPDDAINVVFTDAIENVLTIEEVSFPQGTYTISGNTVTATIADARELAGQTVVLTIKASLKKGISDETLIRLYGTTNIPNKATVSINNKPQVTNEVLVTPPGTPSDEPEKTVNDLPHVDLGSMEEGFTYKISQKVPSDAYYLEFTDVLEDVLTVVDTPTLSANGVELTNGVAISVDGNNVTATLANDGENLYVTDLVGQTVVLTINAKIADGITPLDLVNKYGTLTVPNEAVVTINDNPTPTNKVTVTPPTPPTETPVKAVNGVEHVDLANRNEPFTYTVSQVIPVNAVNVVFSDTLERVLEFVGTPTINVEGVTPVIAGQEITATIADAKALAGQTVTLTFQAKIKDSVTDEQLKALGYVNRTVPNKATVTIDGEGKVTNEVTVTPPPTPSENPEKKVNSVDALTLDNRGQVFTYTISQKIPTDAINVVFEDTLHEYLEVVNASINAGVEPTVDGQYVRAEIANATEAGLEGKVVTLTINAKIKDSVKNEELVAGGFTTNGIPNKATVTIDGEGKVTNEVIVTPPTVVKTKVAKTWVNAYGEATTWPTDVEKVVVTVTYGEELQVLELTAANPEKETREFKAVTGAEFAVQEVKVEGYTTEITGDGATGFTVTNTEEPETPEEPVKTVSKVKLDDRYEPFTYTISQLIPNGAVNVVFEDTLEDVLTFNGTPTLTLEDGTVIAEGPSDVFTTVDQTITATIADAREYAGKVVTLTFGAVIKNEVQDADLVAKYGEARNVPNKATVKIDGQGKVTNEVIVTPPTPEEPEEPVKKVNELDRVELPNFNDIFNYTISQVIPKGAINVVFEDTLVDVLEFVGTPRLTLEDGTVIAEGPSDVFTIEGQTITATIADAREYAGKTITLSFNATIKQGVTPEIVIEQYGTGMAIPNKAQVTFDGKPKTSNEVIVIPPTPEEPGKVNIPVTKVWDDEGAEDRRPREIVVRLLANGNEVASATITEEQSWRYVFMNMPELDEEGKAIQYTITEDTVTYYLTYITGDQNGYTITNRTRPWWPETPNDDFTEFTLEKKVGEGIDANKSYKVIVTIDGTNYEIELTPNDIFKFDYVPVGAKVSVKEVESAEYVATYYVDGKKANTVEFTAENGKVVEVVVENNKPTEPDKPNKPSKPTKPSVPSKPTVDTSDRTNTGAWAFTFFMSLVALLGGALFRKRFD